MFDEERLEEFFQKQQALTRMQNGWQVEIIRRSNKND